MDPDEICLCHLCGKMFYRLSTLESHIKWKHAEKTDAFMCDQCGRTFQKKFNLEKHKISGVHYVTESVNCAMCNHRALNRKLMGQHYVKFHNIVLKENNKCFKTPEDFYNWKNEYENNTRSRFVKLSSSRKRKNNVIRSSYFCHRDGNFISKGRNIRHLKIKGSNKINAHCPARMEVDFTDGVVVVSYIDVHLGHELDVSRLSLDPVDRALIAERLAMKVPFEKILEEINKPKENEVKRVNLLTRKDLWNIVDAFKIDPNNIVYSQCRGRKKKNILPKKEPKRNTVLSQIASQVPKISNNGVIRNIVYTSDHPANDELISVDEDDDTTQYALISDENEGGDGTCLIINENGEIQSISGHQIICTEDGEIEIITEKVIRDSIGDQNTETIVEECSDQPGEVYVLNEEVENKNVSEVTCNDKKIIREKNKKNNKFIFDDKVKHNDTIQLEMHSGADRFIKEENTNDFTKCPNLSGTEVELISDAIDTKENEQQQNIIIGEEVLVSNPQYEFVMFEGMDDEYIIISATDDEINDFNAASKCRDSQYVYKEESSDDITIKEESLNEYSYVEVDESSEQYIEISEGNQLVWDNNQHILQGSISVNNELKSNYISQVLPKSTFTLGR